MKTIFLHIGNYKTGTSAIQEFCSKNRKLLLANGIDYLLSGRTPGNPHSHAALPLSLIAEQGRYTPTWYNGSEKSSHVLTEVRTEVERSTCDNILISSEECYRIAGLNNETSAKIMESISQAFKDHRVEVLMYVRPPTSFLKSWYNQANKANMPTRRFTDFVYHINSSLLVPQRNANLWRKYFGNDCLNIEPYHLYGAQHLNCFFQNLGVSPDISWQIPDVTINPKRREDTLELDRIARILTLGTAADQAIYLKNEATDDEKKQKELIAKLDRINQEFLAFCADEGVAIKNEPISLSDLLEHESIVNSIANSNPGILRRFKALAYNSSFVARYKKWSQRLK